MIESRNAIIGADGTATIALGPTSANDHWSVNKLSTSITGTTTQKGELRVYLGNAEPGRQVAVSYVPSGDDSPESDLFVESGEQLQAIYSDCVIGATAHFVVHYRRVPLIR